MHRRLLASVVLPGLAVVSLGLAPAPAPLTPAPLPTTQGPTAPAADTTAPRGMQVSDFDAWRSVSSVEVSPDGAWITFDYNQRDTDGALRILNVASGDTLVVERGTSPVFSDDGRWLAALVPPTQEEQERLRERRDPIPREAVLVELATGGEVRWSDATGVSFATGSSHLAIRKRQADSDAEHDGVPLILRNLSAGTDEVLGYVGEFAFNEPGTHLAYTISAPDADGNGVVLLTLADGARRPLANAPEVFRRLQWEAESGTALAVLRGDEVEDHVEDRNTLLVWTALDTPTPAHHVLDPDADDVTWPEGFVLSERQALRWSHDGERVFLGIREQRESPPESDDPRADVDIWHWADERLQSVQQVQANRDRNRTHLAVFHLEGEGGRFVQLADSTLTSTNLSPRGSALVAQDGREWVHDWQPGYANVYQVDVDTGERTRFLDAHLRVLGFSPDDRHFLWWEDGHVHVRDLASGEHRNLTANTPVSFESETFNRKGEVPPTGIQGWAANDAGLILATRLDLWLVPLDGSEGRNLTASRDADEAIRFRPVTLDPDEDFIDLDRPLLLSAFHEDTKRSGYWRLDGGELEPLVWEDRSFSRLAKAEDADRLVWVQESFRESPDLWTGTTDFEARRQLTDANPHHDDFLWGDRILFDFVTDRGDTLQATLAIPDDWSPGDAPRPMLVNYYEQNSQNLNRYPTPRHASGPQFARFVSHGYMVLQPDIAFHLGDTHSQMKDAVMAAADSAVAMGYADPDRIGLHGHSFSGQGTAHISTQTDRFAAILAGAAATNLVSDFNQLWTSAGTNQHRYNTYGQGRFATNPYDDFELYVQESAVHHAATMDTPLLILHGTNDGSVEWLQAVEFYNALRFHEKPVILLSYPGEGHSLGRHENRVDFQIRMHQFFDHHLMGTEAPGWMTEGVPYLDKPYHGVSEPSDEDPQGLAQGPGSMQGGVGDEAAPLQTVGLSVRDPMVFPHIVLSLEPK